MNRFLIVAIIFQTLIIPAFAINRIPSPGASSEDDGSGKKPKKRDPRCEKAAAPKVPAKLNDFETMTILHVSKFLQSLHESHTEGGDGMDPEMKPMLELMPLEIQPDLAALTVQMPEGMMRAGLNRVHADRRALVLLMGFKAFYKRVPGAQLWSSEKLIEIFKNVVPAKSFYELARQQLTVFAMAPTQDDALHLAAFMRIGTEALGLEMQNADLSLDLFGLAERMQFVIEAKLQPRAFMLSMAAIGDPVFFDEAKEALRNLCSAEDDDELLARAARNECGWSEEEPLLQSLYNFQSTRPEIVEFRDRFKAAVKKGNEDLDHYLELLARKPLL